MGIDTATIRREMEAADWRVEHLSQVSKSVYRIEVAGGSVPKVRYVKVVNQELVPLLEPFTGDLSGVPPNELVIGKEYAFQVMQPAPGRQLSFVLPVLLVPGIWRMRRAVLSTAFTGLGRNLSELHDDTDRDRRTFSIDGLHLDKFGVFEGGSYATQLAQDLPDAVVTRLARIHQAHPTLELDRSVVHGDLIPNHLRYRAGELTMIDFDRAAIAGRFEDCVSLSCTLDLLVNRLPFTRRAQYRFLIDRFYAGYGDRPDDTTDRLLKLVKYASLLQFYLTKTAPVYDERSLDQATLTRWLDIRLLRRRISEMTESLISDKSEPL